MATLTKYTATNIHPLRDRILVRDMQFQERLTRGGIILPSDDTKSQGIRPRWGKVYAIGPEQKDVAVGEYILVKHGRWTRGVTIEIDDEEMVLRMVDNDDILLVSTEEQLYDETWSDAVVGQSDRRQIDGSLHNDGTQQD